MKKTLFFTLCTFFLVSRAMAVEIYANGHKYDSLQAYKVSERSMVIAHLRKAAPLDDSSLHQLYVLGIENGLRNALQDFYENRQQPDFELPHTITPGELQQTLRQAVISSPYPKLLIAQAGKVRILGMSSDHPQAMASDPANGASK